MFPASLRADCSSLPRLGEVPRFRRSILSASLSPAVTASTNTVCPLMSPDIAIWTATTSTPGAISGTKSPGGTTLTIGTLIMIRVAVRVDSAVAACPAPMFATSRSASRRAVLMSVVLSTAGVLRGSVISKETGGVNDESGRSIAKNGRTAEESLTSAHAVKLLDDDFLLSNEFVHDQRRLALGQLDEHYLPARRSRGGWKAYTLAKPDGREQIVANRHHLSTL